MGSYNYKAKSCAWDPVHEYCLGRAKETPTCLEVKLSKNVTSLCSCTPVLHLAAGDLNEKDFSKNLCELLGKNCGGMYIEVDLLNGDGEKRLISLVSKVLELFDQRLLVCLVTEKDSLVDAFSILVEGSFDFVLKKVKSVGIESVFDRGEESLAKKTRRGLDDDDDMMLERKNDSLEAKIVLLETEYCELESSHEKLKEELRECKKSNLELENEVQSKNSLLGNYEGKVKQLQSACIGQETLANEHLEDRNYHMKQVEIEREKVLELSLKLSENESTIAELEKECTRLKEELVAIKSKTKCKSYVETRKDVVISAISDYSNIDIIDVQSRIRFNQELHPYAGSIEILHRSVNKLLCEEVYQLMNDKSVHCKVKVVRGSFAASKSLSTFEGVAGSKKKAKINAFDNFLVLLLSLQ